MGGAPGITCDARMLVDNLGVSRARAGRVARALSRADLEDWLLRKAQLRPPGWLDQMRELSVRLADELGLTARQAATIGRLAATHALTDSTDAELSGVRLELP